MEGAACETGGRVYTPDDDKSLPPPHLCPQVQHAPQTLLGQQVLELIRAGSILRTGWSGIEGINLAETLARLPQYPDRDVIALVADAEAGIQAGLAERRERRSLDREGAE